MKNLRFLPLIPLILGLALLQFLVNRQAIPSYLFPAPYQVWEVLMTDGQIWAALRDTSLNACLGFLLTLVAGACLGTGLASSRWIEKMFYPYAVFFQTVPIIAIAPLLVIWFGYGQPTVIASTFIVSVFPMIAATLDGIRSTDQNLLDLFRLYRATRLQRLLKLQLPFALPSILTGARIASGLAVIGAIVGEFVGGGGLGGIVDESLAQQRVDRVFAAVTLAAGLGWVFFAVLNGLSRVLLRNWHASQRG
ncbi:MAG: ABC transporter permease [Bdellovibrionales bacterium]|nr:ABC transporter permease [Bdellovibrionales bacterium]